MAIAAFGWPSLIKPSLKSGSFSMFQITRRYPHPTCTLLIHAERSPLSQWQKFPVVKNLQFELQVSDPRRLDPEPVKVWGEQPQLEQLSTLVQDYVQETILASSPQTLSLHDTLIAMPQEAIALTPHSRLQHQLYIGHDQVKSSQPVIDLSVTQLLDLATALADFQNELQVLPMLPSHRTGRPRGWQSAAALVLGAIALSTGVYYYSETQTPETSLSNNPIPIVPRSPDVEVLPPEPPPQGAPLPTPLMPPDLEGLGTLAPPTGVDRPPRPVGSGNDGPITPPPRTEIQRRSEPAPGSAPAADAPAPTAASPDVGPPPPVLETEITPRPSGTPRLPNLPPLQEQESTIARAPEAAPVPQAAPAPRTPTAESRNIPLPFDSLPQVEEVRTYFQARWQPPRDLNQGLEYRLRLNPDGSLQRLLPLGTTAAEYLPQTPMPRLGEAFVSPLTGAQTAEIRLVLERDGQVRTFLEGVRD